MEVHHNNLLLSPWNCVHCETIGRSHIQEGTVCQDKTFALTENGVTAFALADGAGSAKLSHYGAETVTEGVCRLLCRNFNEYFQNPSSMEVKTEILRYLRQELEQTAARHGCTLRDLASTMLAVAVCDDRYLLMHVGDGVIGYVKGDELKVASAPSNGEFANITTFVTSSSALQDMRVRKGTDPQIKGFVLMSDGCEASLYSKQRQQIAPVLHRLIGRLGVTSSAYMTPRIQESLDQVVTTKTRDDCSLVLAAKVEKTYAQMSAEEQNEYFEIDTENLKPSTAENTRLRFVKILNFTGMERTLEEVTACLRLKDCQRALKKWISPLLELGYLQKTPAGKLRRIVGPEVRPQEKAAPEPMPQEKEVPPERNTQAKEEVSDE